MKTEPKKLLNSIRPAIDLFFSKKFLLAFAAIMFFIVFGKFFSILYFPDSEVTLEKGDPLVKLHPTLSLKQTFTADRNNLSKIEFLLRTPGPKGEDVVKMEIADENCSSVISIGKLEKSFVSSGNLYEFKFKRIPDSEGKNYCLVATLMPGHSDSKAVNFFTAESKNDKFVVKDKSNSEEIGNRSLSMRLVHKNENIFQDLSELNQRISQYKPWFLKHYFLYTISVLFVILTVGIAVILIII